ncbi:MAG: LapA family protein [Dechloromonas sp.]|nr:LapA family protein [Dechloromonas sp.]
MTLFTWLLRLVIFVFLVLFATQNTENVVINFVLGHQWQAPLVILLLGFFAGGAMLGILSVLSLIFRQRREISRLKRALSREQAALAASKLPTA